MSIGDASTRDGASSFFTSSLALRSAHQELIEQRRQKGDAEAALLEIDAFIRRGSAIGVLLDGDDERESIQSLLDYWANTLERAGKIPPDSTLAEFDPTLGPELPDTACPYLGLDPFTEKDAPRFFGRKRLIDDLIARMHTTNLVAVVGSSGSGKSSVVRAGLIPALKAVKGQGLR